MKTSILYFLLLPCLSFAALAGDATNNIVGVWKVNWDKTPAITSIPEYYRSTSRFKSVEEYRDFVTNRTKGLVFEIKTNNTATLRYASGKSETYSWEASPQAPKYDIWLQTYPHRLSFVSVGHGLKVSDTDPNTAMLTFQIEWDENVATRIPLVMERQTSDSAKIK